MVQGRGSVLASVVVVAALALIGGPGTARAAGLPQVGEIWTESVNATSAELKAMVNPNGSPTSLRFEYSAGAIWLQAGSPIAIGSGTALLTRQRELTGLQPGTAYRYRLVASNGEGSVTAGVNAAGGPLAFTTREIAPVFGLPDGRGWEMVSPADKNGGAIEGPEANFGGGVYQADSQGGAVTYTSASSFATPQGSPGASQYISRRAPWGWETENVTQPLLSGGYGDQPDGVPFELFSPDLARGVHLNPRRCAPVGPCSRGYSLRESAGGALRPLLEAPDLRFAGATPELSQIVLEGSDLYRWGAGALHQVNFEPGGVAAAPGARLAAAAGAVSADGNRVYWTAGGNLFLREGGQTVQVDDDPMVGGGGTFETASADGTVAFFSKAGHLYRYQAPADLTADLTPSGDLEGVLGASADGSRVYYLTGSGLFLRVGASTIAVAAAADASNYPPATGTARVSADGARLAFVSGASLTGYDNAGRSQVFLYGPPVGGGAPGLVCVSCNPTGQRPSGAATIPGAFANGSYQGYKPRVLTGDGSRLFFETFDGIASQDTNEDRDVYQWQAQGSGTCARAGGCIGLLSSGRSEDGARFIDASADGADAFFITDGSLVPGDPGSVDLYDARIGGGFPVPSPPIPCVADACQPLPGEPDDPAPGTLLHRPQGNPPPGYPKAKPKKAKPRHKKAKPKHKQKRRRGKHRGGRR